MFTISQSHEEVTSEVRCFNQYDGTRSAEKIYNDNGDVIGIRMNKKMGNLFWIFHHYQHKPSRLFTICLTDWRKKEFFLLTQQKKCFIWSYEKWIQSRWCCQLTDLVYDGVFEVLQWLLFLSAVPPVQLLTGWCVTAKALPDISAISALTAVKHGNCSSLTPLLNPVRTRKSLIWPWMALDAGQLHALWALASTRFYVT